ncbi:FOX2-Hydratase-dehydrogenase-epimerase, peroxisomal [Pleurostoma richardsiae]|uniref:FOX2-Hydratase-dehydrogenase-epimerase, peroxisomal n=1 Tax=Pleurostoma richardsiae TaxID=41990 RepID=A0AA38VDP3_9PEZI|nr:FOX2-Hydratase-dehydrogenase-epimerase, peroxisomal [Pleurostoma richardsiae]
MSVRDRVAIVTGAGGGLGREYALLLASRGAKVVVNDYGGTLEGESGNISRAQSVVDEITGAGGVAIADGHDVSIKSDTVALVERTLAEFGRVDILINNAGISGRPSSHADLDGEAFMRVLEISVLGSQQMTSAVWNIMERQGYGRIIYVSSDGIMGFGAGGDCAYAASKGATFAIARDLGRYAPRYGIKVNAVMPSGHSRMGDLSEASKRITRTYFDASKAAPLVVALASDECPVSGECFSAGAGRSARVTLATFPGHAHENTPEGFIRNWNEVMGDSKDIYIPKSTLDHVRYGVLHASGLEVADISEFGIVPGKG